MWWTRNETGGSGEEIHLFVEVTCRSGSQSYVVTSEYELLQRKGNSTYAPMSDQIEVNPAKNWINRLYRWRWKYLGSV